MTLSVYPVAYLMTMSVTRNIGSNDRMTVNNERERTCKEAVSRAYLRYHPVICPRGLRSAI
jgi:hypothetical protein